MKFLQNVSAGIIMVLFSAVLVLELFIQPEYDFYDFPFFAQHTLPLLLAAADVFLLSFLWMKLGEKTGWNPWIPLVLFFAASVAFLAAVPMVPVSDQGIVFDIAVNDLADPGRYMDPNANVIPTILYFHVLSRIFGVSLWVPKTANVVCSFLTLLVSAKIYGGLTEGENAPAADAMRFGAARGGTAQTGGSRSGIPKAGVLFASAERQFLWFGAVFLPVFFYGNHIYNEVPSVTLAVLAVWIALRGPERLHEKVLLILLSCAQMVLRQSGVIFVIAIAMYLFLKHKQHLFSILYLLLVAAGYLAAGRLCAAVVGADAAAGYPVWSFLRMGINEAEFGFQDQSHAADVTLTDVISRYREYGPARVLTILGKKTYWLWGEGTFMSGRYGLGYPANDYQYRTVFTDLISGSEDRKLRLLANAVLRGQYLLILAGALAGTAKNRKNDRWGLLYFALVGFVLFYLFWEIKSRYLYGLYPFLLMLGLAGWNTAYICCNAVLQRWIQK